MMTNIYNTTVYTGVTSQLIQRVYQHKHNQVEGFTKRYHLYKLVYFEEFADIKDAIEREKQIKAGSRSKKDKLIQSLNPEWKDLYEELV